MSVKDCKNVGCTPASLAPLLLIFTTWTLLIEESSKD